jgi:DNA-binding CsgD family transcriptional regulator
METTGPWPEAPNMIPRLVAAAECGWRDDAARRFYLMAQEEMAKAYEVMPGTMKLLAQGVATGHAAATRHELCDDREWYGAYAVNEYRMPAHNDGHAVSVFFDRRRGIVGLLSINQDTSDPTPTVRTRRILSLLHSEIAPLIGTRLATEGHASLKGLTPRLRQTLARMLEGDSEKQVAAVMRITPATAHEYVGRLYEHFGVSSRGELMAYFIRRTPVAAPQPHER